MRRVFVMMAGLALAIPAAMIVLVVALVVVEARTGAEAAVAGFLDVIGAVIRSDDPEALLRNVLRSTAVICCLPVILAALVGEAAGLTSRLWYIGGTATLSIALPLTVAHSGAGALSSPTILSPLLITGAAAGAVYGATAAPSRRIAGPREAGLSITPGEP